MMYRRQARQRWLLGLLIAAAATVVTIDFRSGSGGPLQRVSDGVFAVVSPLQQAMGRAVQGTGQFFGGVAELGRVRKDNARLRSRVEQLESRLGRYPDMLRELRRLQSLLDEKDWAVGKKTGARVVGLGPSNYEWSVFIDKGTSNGVKEGMSVIASEGLIGRVIQAQGRVAKVRLVVDSQSAVGGRLTQSGETGALGGRGEGDLRFELIDPNVAVKKGETVVTSGYDKGIFPPGIPIGRVSSVRRSRDGLAQTALVRPFADFDRLDVVMVLLDSGPLAGGSLPDRPT